MNRKIQIWISAFFLLSIMQSCQVGRMLVYNFADIRDYKKFPNRKIEKNSTKFVFPAALNPLVPKKIIDKDSVEIPFEKFLTKNKTVAFLIIKNDSIYSEHYFDGYSRESIVPSFSVAKSVLSILIGAAIEDGYIHSIQDKVTKYVPDMKHAGFEKISIEHLLQMTAGLKFHESYINPFAEAPAFYYGKNLERKTKNLKLERPAGETFEYNSGNAQLLGLILANALPEGTTISDYLEKRIWKPLGMRYDATWSLDEKNGIEKTFCCLNARAIDLAKIGRLYLNDGDWNGRQIVPKNWVERSTAIDSTNGSAKYYQYQWWLPSPSGDFMANGYLGQYIYVNPNKNLVIVRLGKKAGNVEWKDIFVGLAANY